MDTENPETARKLGKAVFTEIGSNMVAKQLEENNENE
jgi:hypothetical protein